MDSGSVQHVSGTGSGTTAITAKSETETFLVPTGMRRSGGALQNGWLTRLFLNDDGGGNVDQVEAASEASVDWAAQVVQSPNVSVTEINKTGVGDWSEGSLGLTASKVLLFSSRHGAGTSTYGTDTAREFRTIPGATVTADSADNDQTGDVTTYAVEFTDSTTVQHFDIDYGSVASGNQTITSVDLTRSAASNEVESMAPYLSVCDASVGDTRYDSCLPTLDLTTATNVAWTIGDPNVEPNGTTFAVVEFAESTNTGTISATAAGAEAELNAEVEHVGALDLNAPAALAELNADVAHLGTLDLNSPAAQAELNGIVAGGGGGLGANNNLLKCQCSPAVDIGNCSTWKTPSIA